MALRSSPRRLHRLQAARIFYILPEIETTVLACRGPSGPVKRPPLASPTQYHLVRQRVPVSIMANTPRLSGTFNDCHTLDRRAWNVQQPCGPDGLPMFFRRRSERFVAMNGHAAYCTGAEHSTEIAMAFDGALEERPDYAAMIRHAGTTATNLPRLKSGCLPRCRARPSRCCSLPCRSGTPS